MREERNELIEFILLGFILAAFMTISLNVWGCTCKELATELQTPVPRAMEGREEWMLERLEWEQRRQEYLNSRNDGIIF